MVTFLHGGSPFKVSQPDSFRIRLDRRSTFNYSRDILRSPDDPDGEMGRRVLVRWDMTVGPDDRDLVVLLPKGTRFTGGELRPTISEIKSISYKDLISAINDSANWQSLFAHFDYEKALSGYIATYPHHLGNLCAGS
jgi:hypothetical protein